ncbi:MAG: hypothetical protein OIF48_16550 [Silicimonas sp.]|nr:hypothetical protein [Silicimonas sp.]
MPRLSIDITSEQHEKLKANAAREGRSLEEFVLGRVLSPSAEMYGLSEDTALDALSAVLDARVAQARNGDFSAKTIDEIRDEARRAAGVSGA